MSNLGKIERCYYSLQEASGLAGYDTSDLIHFGANGKLPIYALLVNLRLKKYDFINFPSDDDQFPEALTTVSPVRLWVHSLAEIEGCGKAVCKVVDRVDRATGLACAYEVVNDSEAQFVEVTASQLVIMSNDMLLFKYAKQADEKRTAGRYTLEEAADIIAENAGERVEVMRSKLVESVETYKLRAFEPGRNAQVKYGQGEGKSSQVRTYYEECTWSDLNKWLDEYEPTILYRFSKPENESESQEFDAEFKSSNDEETDAGLLAAFSETVYNGKPISWRYWVHQMPNLSSSEAACLLCGLDPDIFENLHSRPNRNDPTEMTAKAKSIQRLAEQQKKNSAQPAQWLEWADSHGFKVHIGFRHEVGILQQNDAEEAKPPQVSCAMEAAKGITKSQVLQAFEQMVKAIQLKKALGDGKGLFGDDGARTRKGTPGGKHKALWNPVVLAIGLNEKYHVPMLHLKNAFREHTFLQEWRSAWQEKLDLLRE